jgi:hypothetical protein
MSVKEAKEAYTKLMDHIEESESMREKLWEEYTETTKGMDVHAIMMLQSEAALKKHVDMKSILPSVDLPAIADVTIKNIISAEDIRKGEPVAIGDDDKLYVAHLGKGIRLPDLKIIADPSLTLPVKVCINTTVGDPVQLYSDEYCNDPFPPEVVADSESIFPAIYLDRSYSSLNLSLTISDALGVPVWTITDLVLEDMHSIIGHPTETNHLKNG